MKRLFWLGDSYKILKSFPRAAQSALGSDLLAVQLGSQPNDFKSMATVGKGVEEIRVWVESGTYRVIYIARLEGAVYVLHAFPKKTQQTARRDVEMARARLAELLRLRQKST